MERQANEPVHEDNSDEDIRDRARELYAVDGETEIDTDADINRGDDDGAYVQAWVWVEFGA